MLKEKDFAWHAKRANNIETNPVEYLYCIVNLGGNTGKLYAIKAQYPADSNGLITSKNPEYYILFETSCSKTLRMSPWNFGEYEPNPLHFVRVFKTLEEAKSRAFVQYSHVYLSAAKDVLSKERIEKHFVVK